MPTDGTTDNHIATVFLIQCSVTVRGGEAGIEGGSEGGTGRREGGKEQGDRGKREGMREWVRDIEGGER